MTSYNFVECLNNARAIERLAYNRQLASMMAVTLNEASIVADAWYQCASKVKNGGYVSYRDFRDIKADLIFQEPRRTRIDQLLG